MEALKFAELVNDARVYYKGEHVGTFAIEYKAVDRTIPWFLSEEFNTIGELYVCQNNSDGCRYRDRRGFNYTWYLVEISQYFVEQNVSGTIESFLTSIIVDGSNVKLPLDKIVLRRNITLYDLC